MRKILRSFIFGLLFALIVLTPLHAQTAANTQADATAANTAPARQAPDEVMKKLSGLVHAGKYAEAQGLTTGLLLAYPDDQRLIKAKALLDKSLAAASANTAPGSNPLTSNVTSPQPVANTNSEQLTGMDKVDYSTLVVLARQAQQNTDLEQQKTQLQQFLDQSSPFLQKHPNEMLLWQLRAASAISLDEPMAGYDAGQKLLAMGADSNDSNLLQLLVQLKNKGWLDKEKHQTIEREREQATWTDPATGYTWTKQDNGSDINFIQAKDYCGNLRLAGYSTWQLPTTEEIVAINEQVTMGSIKLSSKVNLAWTTRVGEPCFYMFDVRGAHCANAANRRFVRALCIRRRAQ
jgi:hypothetical protein